MEFFIKKDLVSYLSQFVTDARWQKMQEVLNQRTRRLTVVLEGIHKPHNASAVLRSCDGFGIQDVHIVERDTEFDPNRQVSMGADRWLTLHRYDDVRTNNTAACLDRLKDNGYTLVATTPHDPDTTIDRVPVTEKTAILFGSELRGLSDYACRHADIRAKIPMYGFSESFNISVSAALSLYELTKRLRGETDNWQLGDRERVDLQLAWLRQSIRASSQLEEEFLTARANC
ncbi:TrmH family RNA methyltransferase [Baaleninema simplex]|uniref:TrmH family RNA methyltransferase n=1 Tax=Baaleninema simplex TaxID=2862350 RepID=UPI000348C5EF|nr:RNA methyltransferase [Baaleninema simplex]